METSDFTLAFWFLRFFAIMEGTDVHSGFRIKIMETRMKSTTDDYCKEINSRTGTARDGI